MKKIAFIPVRGGSKSIPLKNIKPFCGKPLVYWTVAALVHSGEIDEIVVATDSHQIKQVVNSFGFKQVKVYDRDAANATDTASTESVMLEYMQKHELSGNDLFMLVQATSPMLQAAHVKAAIKHYENEKADSLLSCVRIKRFFWDENGKSLNYDYTNRPRRQDFKGELMENGALYISLVEHIIKSKNRLSGKVAVFEMPEFTAVEIDEEDDWMLAEQLMKKHVLSKVATSKDIKLFLSDVDGVMTDAGMYYTENGDEIKKFSTYDGMAFQLLRERGIKTGIITSENRQLNERRADKLKLDYVFQGVKNKMEILNEICKREDISPQQVAFIGDDINDFEVLSAVGYAACPANAVDKIKSIRGINQLNKKGGEGVLREFVDLLF